MPRITAGMNFICAHCHAQCDRFDIARAHEPGSLIIELLLHLLFIALAVFFWALLLLPFTYIAWRLHRKYSACPACGSRR